MNENSHLFPRYCCQDYSTSVEEVVEANTCIVLEPLKFKSEAALSHIFKTSQSKVVIAKLVVYIDSRNYQKIYKTPDFNNFIIGIPNFEVMRWVLTSRMYGCGNS